MVAVNRRDRKHLTGPAEPPPARPRSAGAQALLTYVNAAKRAARKAVGQIAVTMFSRQLSIQPLTRGKIGQSFPLVQLAMPDCSLEAWQHYALDHLSPGGLRDSGILCAEDERGYILGLLVYQIHHDLSEGNSLLVKKLIAQDQFQSARRDVGLSLVRAMEDLARDHRCTVVHALVRASQGNGRDEWLLKLLTDCGHRVDSLQLCKALTGPLEEPSGPRAASKLDRI